MKIMNKKFKKLLFTEGVVVVFFETPHRRLKYDTVRRIGYCQLPTTYGHVCRSVTSESSRVWWVVIMPHT